MTSPDFYNTLGVTKNASDEEVKRAYRRLAGKYHPDRNKEGGAEDRYKQIQAAYEVLRNKEKREAYDRFGDQWEAAMNAKKQGGYSSYDDMVTGGFGGSGGFGGGRVNPEDLGDLFQNLFGDGNPGFHDGFGHRTAPNRDEEARIHLRLEDVYEGGARSLNVNGQSLNVRIPAGIGEGKRIRLKGRSRMGSDLYLKVHLEPHPSFRVENQDIHIDLPLTPWEAFLGTTVNVPTLGGDVGMKIPAGSQTGRKLRMKHRGLPGNPGGDQFVHLKIINPPMSDEQARKAYEQLREQSDFNPRGS